MYEASLHKQLNRLLNQFEKEITKKKLNPEEFRDFYTRLSANFYNIRRHLEVLYEDKINVEEQLSTLATLLFDQYQKRPKNLKKLDRERENKPNWLLQNQWVGYMLYVDHFARDLKDFEEKIEYLEKLGVNWIHLMPILQSPEGKSDGGYAVSDYQLVDPKYGSMADVKRIAQKFHEKDMLLTLDLVLNHTSDEHKWAKKAQQGDHHHQDYYYMYETREIPDQFEASMPEVFPTSAPGNFTFNEAAQKWVMTVFHDYQWDLNYTNPTVFMEMLNNLIFLANQGTDIIRIDAPAFLWKQIGTNCQNLPQAHRILQLMKACCEVVASGVKFIAEAIVAPQEIIRYFGTGREAGHECDVAYNATFMALLWDALATQESGLLNKVMKGLPGKPLGTTWINYLRCHDDIGLGFEDKDIYALGYDAVEHRKFLLEYFTGRFEGSLASGAPFMYNPKTGDARISGALASLAGLERALYYGNKQAVDIAIQKITMLHSIILSFGGLPMIYSGDEIGMTNDYSYLNDYKKSYDNRWMHRPDFDWEKAGKRHERGSIENRIFNNLKKLIALRKASPELADLNNCSIEHIENKHIFSYLRWDNAGRRTLIMHNLQDVVHYAKTDILYKIGFNMSKGIVDKFSGKAPKYSSDLIEFQPYQFYWLSGKMVT